MRTLNCFICIYSCSKNVKQYLLNMQKRKNTNKYITCFSTGHWTHFAAWLKRLLLILKYKIMKAGSHTNTSTIHVRFMKITHRLIPLQFHYCYNRLGCIFTCEHPNKINTIDKKVTHITQIALFISEYKGNMPISRYCWYICLCSKHLY